LRWPVATGKQTDLVTSPGLSSAFAGFRFPREVISLAVRWYLRYGLSYRDVEGVAGRARHHRRSRHHRPVGPALHPRIHRRRPPRPPRPRVTGGSPRRPPSRSPASGRAAAGPARTLWAHVAPPRPGSSTDWQTRHFALRPAGNTCWGQGGRSGTQAPFSPRPRRARQHARWARGCDAPGYWATRRAELVDQDSGAHMPDAFLSGADSAQLARGAPGTGPQVSCRGFPVV
jgi:hypothetical protein